MSHTKGPRPIPPASPRALRSLITQSGRLSDPDVLRGMRAGEAGVFFGTLSDRTMRTLELAPALLGDRGEGSDEA